MKPRCPQITFARRSRRKENMRVLIEAVAIAAGFIAAAVVTYLLFAATNPNQ